ncbi:hypothetical protein HYE76_10405 [Pseudomonas tolaasii]|uniref:hypothetical protein n=1 Tax=Pseudomonas tolaasii TaxID=29442 RepID=UPI0015A30A38|nr:hypothetical protein [Pseudomonas tolaasii]NWC26877.1 hypothetical protein [Pseudomonas tolaasii]
MSVKEQNLQQLIDRIAKDAQAALKLAREVHGKEAFLFCESDNLVVMAGDCDGSCRERQKFIRAEASGTCPIGGGAW